MFLLVILTVLSPPLPPPLTCSSCQPFNDASRQNKKSPLFTTALIAGDCVILDAIAKAGLLDKIQVVFVDTYFLFPESVDFLHEVRRGRRGFDEREKACLDV